MPTRILRLFVVVALAVGTTLVALTGAPSAIAPAGAAGVGQYSPAQWWPLRGSNLIGCAKNSPGTVCGGSYHSYNAIDIQGPEGQPIYAAGAGLATVAGTSTACAGAGISVVVDHGPYGKTMYAHLSSIAATITSTAGGAWVDENTIIGYVGHTGNVSGCTYNHLHFEYSSSGVWGSSASPTPDLQACVGGTLRTYPDHFGATTTWVGFPGHTYTAVSDGTACAFQPCSPFTDVPSSNVFCPDIQWMNSGGIDTGYPGGTYAPTVPNSRAMMADQIYNLADEPAFSPPEISPFSDVPVDHPRYLQIAWLASTGLTTGYADGTYRPDATVSRQSMAAFFFRMADATYSVSSEPFPDVPLGHTFDDEIAWLATTGITTGYDDDTFRPTLPVARQTMAAFLHRYDGI